MKILIIDDDSIKAGKIVNIFQMVDGLNSDDIDIVLDLNSARHKLREELYDLLVLDLHIPDAIGGVPKSEIGIAFIDEICSTNGFYIPLDIVALTALEDAKCKFISKPELMGFTLLQYDQTETYWSDYLKSRAKYLLECNKRRCISKRLCNCDVLWLTTVNVEAQAVNSMYEWIDYHIDNDPLRYRHTKQTVDSQVVDIIHVQIPEMGFAASAAVAAKGILLFKPQYVIMTGIAAGLGNDLSLGEVVIADSVWNYDSGKYEESDDGTGGMIVTSTPDGKVQQVSLAWSEKLKDFSEKLDIGIRTIVGRYACGNSVVASEKKVKADVKAHSRKCLALDMESYGVLLSSAISATAIVPTAIIKGKSDSGNKDKNDDAQEIAATNAAKVAKELIVFLFSDRAQTDRQY